MQTPGQEDEQSDVEDCPNVIPPSPKRQRGGQVLSVPIDFDEESIRERSEAEEDEESIRERSEAEEDADSASNSVKSNFKFHGPYRSHLVINGHYFKCIVF